MSSSAGVTSGPAADLMEVLALEERGPDLYVGLTPATTLQRIFGGQVAAQALTAAQAQATATATAAQAGAGTSGPATGQSGTPGPHHGNVSDDGGQRDCPPGQQRRQGGDEGGTPEEAPAAPAAA